MSAGEGWNPWHGCHKLSPGCQNCYMHRRDASVGRDGDQVYKTTAFDLPICRRRDGSYRLRGPGEVFTCGTSDFFLEEADAWRAEAWSFIRQRRDLRFLIITKRIERFRVQLPEDWGAGYENVRIGCTVENQDRADARLPVFLEMPIRRRVIICEPLLEPVNLLPYLDERVEEVVAGGESGYTARTCRYEWILGLHRQCLERRVSFWFKQTGTHFVKDGRCYTIAKRLQHAQARKAGLNFQVEKEEKDAWEP